MRLYRAIPVFVAAAFGLGLLAIGIAGFIRLDASERQLNAKLQAIQAGEIPPENLTALKKYVNPGRLGLPHIAFRSATRSKVDLPVTKDFFNSVNLGDTVRAYEFADGYFIPDSQRPGTPGGKWFLLGLGIALGSAALVVARATLRLTGA